jgi:hypothetical protein
MNVLLQMKVVPKRISSATSCFEGPEARVQGPGKLEAKETGPVKGLTKVMGHDFYWTPDPGPLFFERRFQ